MWLMAAAQFLKTRISLEEKQRVQALATRLLITESVWLKRLVMRALGESAALLPDTIVTQREPERHTRGLVPLPKEELTALKRSVAELGAIGRNLNHIARAANQGGRAALPGPADVLTMLRIAEGLRDHFKGLLKANERSWTGQGGP